MKLKHIAAAVALAAAGTSAHATTVPTDGLFFSAADTTDNSSFFANLNVTTASFLTNNANGTFSLAGDALSDLTAWLGGKANLSNITWNVLGTSSAPIGGLSTGVSLNPVNDTRTGAIGIALGNINTFVQQRNLDLATSDGVAYAVPNFIQDFGNTAIGLDGNGALGDSLVFYQLIQGGRTTQGSITPLLGSFTLNYSAAGGASLNYVASTSNVPVPAAAWLLGSALMGMVGVGRRKKA